MKRPWMPFYPTDFQRDTMDLDGEEIAAYLTLLSLAWERDGSFPNDDSFLKRYLQTRISKFHGHKFNRVIPKILARYFVLEDGQYTNKRLTKELQKADKVSAKQSQNAGKRWAKTKENNDLPDATAMPLQSQSQLHTQIVRKNTREDALSDEFRAFWKIWPYPVAKKAAAKSLRSALQRASLEEICAGVRQYIAAKPPDRQWMNPTTFLNQNRWEDQPATIGVKNGQVSGISAACDRLISIVSGDFHGGSPQEHFGGGAYEDTARILPYRRG
jgi:uncharacterized protein YdaU (DUF1376 family)